MEVKKVINFTEKSFINYTGPNEEFNHKNIIFGYNGRGKSSLAKGIINNYIRQDYKNNNRYRWYNKDYVKNNLRLENGTEASIKGVIANFSKENIDIEDSIKKIQKEIKDVSSLEKEKDVLTTKIRKEIDRIHDARKGETKIQKKPAGFPISKVFDAYMDDLKNARKIENDDNELIKIKGNSELEKEEERIRNLNIPIIDTSIATDLEEIEKIFSKEYSNEEIPSSKIINWINEGLVFHKDSEICKFCGGHININVIKNKAKLYNENEKQKATLALMSFITEIDRVLEQTEGLVKARDNIALSLGENITTYFDDLEKYKENLKVERNNISKKVENITERMPFSKNIVESVLKLINEVYTAIIKQRETKANTILSKVNDLSLLVKGAIGLEISRNKLIEEGINEIENKEKEIKAIETNNIEKKKEIDNLKNSKYNTKDFADHISDTLKMIDVNLVLELEEKNYVLKHARSNETLKLDDISEGEYNLLALLFFYYELFDDKEQKQFKKSIELIVVDDPISSVDDINKMYILELMKELCDLKGPQLFIFTHVWDDFCNLTYGRKDGKDDGYSFFEVKKDEDGSEVVKTKTKETPYKHAFKEIFEFSQKKDAKTLSDCEIYHYPNLMRKVMEEYLSFKITSTVPTRSNMEKALNALFQHKQTAKDQQEMGVFLGVCNILSHQNSRNPDEILRAAKFLMNTIKKSDKAHYDAMKQ